VSKTIKKESQNEQALTSESSAHEQQLARDLEIIGLLRENADILSRHPELLLELEVPHQSGAAISLIERQVSVLRQQAQTQENRLCELMDVARDNERLAAIRHRLAVNLFAAEDLNDVVSLVLDALSNELSADYAVIKLFSDDDKCIEQSVGLFVDASDEALKDFKTMLDHKNTVCGKASTDQKAFLFGESAGDINSAAIVPLVSGANLGLMGLGAKDADRFKSSMGTDFLCQIGELISASLAVHLKNESCQPAKQ